MKILITDNVFQVCKRATDKLCNFVKPTFGPSENKIIVSGQGYTTVVDDGVFVARQFELEDPAENEVAKIVKEVAIRTNSRAGDGTTGSLIMAQALINEIASLGKIDGKAITKELKNAVIEFKDKILKKAKKVTTKAQLKKVAMVSFDNEPIAEIIATLLLKIGPDGVVTLEESQVAETTVDMTDGVSLDKGYLSPYFVTNPERMEAELRKPYILLTDCRLVAPGDIVSLMEKCLKAGKREMLVIAEHTEGDALATFITNRMKGAFSSVVVDLPQFGVDKKELLKDLAMLTGATVISEESGIKMADVTVEHLGTCDKIVCRADRTVIVGGKGDKKELIQVTNYLKDQIASESSEFKKEEFKRRLGRLQNGIAILKVGASTENELKALKYKVEDAVNATRVAFKSGVVRGAGIALAEIETSSEILNRALKYPHKQLLENTGWETKDIDLDIVDPVDVLIAGVESAVSIASLLATTKGILIEKPKEEKNV